MFLNIIKANTAINELETDKTNLLTQLESIKAELAEAQNVIGNFMTEKQGMDTIIANLKAEYEKKLADMQLIVDAERVSASQKASTIVSSIGVEPETVKVSNKPNDNEIVGVWKSLKGSEQLKFYNENREVILSKLNLNK